MGKEGGGFLVAAGEGEACLVSSTQLDPANGWNQRSVAFFSI